MSILINKELSNFVRTSDRVGDIFQSRNSMLFDRVNEYINIPHNAAFNFAITDAFSFSMWIKRAVISNTFELLLSKNNGLTGYWIFISNINDLRFSNGNNNIVITSNTTFINDTVNWYNLICTYDGSQNANGMNWYINNGTSDTNILANSPPGAIETIEPIKLGIWGDNSFPFGGNKNNVSGWNKELNATDRTGIWNGGRPGNLINHPSNGNLIYWEDVDNATFNGTDWVIPDASQNNNIGTSVNMEIEDRVLDSA